ncbi:MAG: hypothetical protein K2X53_06535, partial [Alphaproteobacteria bacterium]|nr:hypothetical protein [Alphaproteobacteria bacterium]
ERIRQRMHQNPVVDISSNEDDGNERENDGEGNGGSAEVSSSESSDEGSEDAGPDLPIVPAVLNEDEDLDTDAYFGQFQTGAHLAAFIKIKNMETQKGVLSAFLESARLEEAKKYQDPNFWRLHLWIFALEKGLLNISQIQPVIKMLQDLVILGDDEGAVI